jgi:hypothetical protein
MAESTTTNCALIIPSTGDLVGRWGRTSGQPEHDRSPRHALRIADNFARGKQRCAIRSVWNDCAGVRPEPITERDRMCARFDSARSVFSAVSSNNAHENRSP